MRQDLNAVLVIGSAPEAVVVTSWDLSAYTNCVAINNEAISFCVCN